MNDSCPEKSALWSRREADRLRFIERLRSRFLLFAIQSSAPFDKVLLAIENARGCGSGCSGWWSCYGSCKRFGTIRQCSNVTDFPRFSCCAGSVRGRLPSDLIAPPLPGSLFDRLLPSRGFACVTAIQPRARSSSSRAARKNLSLVSSPPSIRAISVGRSPGRSVVTRLLVEPRRSSFSTTK